MLRGKSAWVGWFKVEDIRACQDCHSGLEKADWLFSKSLRLRLPRLAGAAAATKASSGKKKGTTLHLTSFLKPEVTSWADDDPENDAGKLSQHLSSLLEALCLPVTLYNFTDTFTSL